MNSDTVTIGKILADHGWVLSVAESCTGGLLGGELTAIAGSSRWFCGGVIAYENRIKRDLLGVSDHLLSTAGAVSEECVSEMAHGVARLCKSDCAVAISGIAGPDGGSVLKPVGTVCIGVMIPEVIKTRTFHFAGDRSAVRRDAVFEALRMLYAALT